MANDVFPPHNLNPDSVPWGRSIQDRVRSMSYSLDNLLVSSAGDNRAIAGQMGALGRQIEDLSGRSSHTTNPPDVTVTHGTGTGQVGPVSSTMTFPAPQGSSRTAILVVSGVYTWTGTNTNPGDIGSSVQAILEIRLNGVRVWSTTTLVQSLTLAPASQGEAISAVASLRVPSTPSTYELRLYTYKSFSGGTALDGARLGSISATLTYGDKV